MFGIIPYFCNFVNVKLYLLYKTCDVRNEKIILIIIVILLFCQLFADLHIADYLDILK